MNWEETFKVWSEPLSQTAQEKCANAESVIRAAIAEDATLSTMDIVVFPQGSYPANTNVRYDSDVDNCVLLQDHIIATYPAGKTGVDFGLGSANLTYGAFKNLVETALVNKVGRRGVTRGNKAFDIHENTYRIDADVVPALRHRRYTGCLNHDGSDQYQEGIVFLPDKGGQIINWPDQTYDNGVMKNKLTSRRYKRMIRIIKRLRNKMQDENIAAADGIASFLIESLVWNVPEKYFGHDTYTDDIQDVLAYTYHGTKTKEGCNEWGEVNELKYLFRTSQPWTRDQAHEFLAAAWIYLGGLK